MLVVVRSKKTVFEGDRKIDSNILNQFSLTATRLFDEKNFQLF